MRCPICACLAWGPRVLNKLRVAITRLAMGAEVYLDRIATRWDIPGDIHVPGADSHSTFAAIVQSELARRDISTDRLVQAGWPPDCYFSGTPDPAFPRANRYYLCGFCEECCDFLNRHSPDDNFGYCKWRSDRGNSVSIRVLRDPAGGWIVLGSSNFSASR